MRKHKVIIILMISILLLSSWKELTTQAQDTYEVGGTYSLYTAASYGTNSWVSSNTSVVRLLNTSGKYCSIQCLKTGTANVTIYVRYTKLIYDPIQRILIPTPYIDKYYTYTITVVEAKCKITFDTQGGAAVTSQSKTKGSKVSEPTAPAREGYVFSGWYKEATGVTAWNFATDTVAANTTIYAKWTAIPVTKITLSESELSLEKEKTATLIASIEPSNALNKVVSWSSENSKIATVDQTGVVEATGYGTTAILATASDGSKITARCKVTVGYPIQYELNGGTNSTQNPSCHYGYKVNLKNPAKQGYRFLGWYTEKSYKNKLTDIPADSKLSYTLYAKWEKVKVEKVSISSAKSEKSNQLTIKIGKLKDAKGYEITYASNAKFSDSKTLTLTSSSKIIKNLKKGRNYYIKARAYQLDSSGNAVFGKFSSVKKVKVK